MTLPPGWPRDLPDSEHPDFEARAVAWLLDLGPVDIRGQRVFHDQPLATAHVVLRHVTATADSLRGAYSQARRELSARLPPEAIERVLEGIEALGAAAAAREREVGLVAEALAGRRWRERL